MDQLRESLWELALTARWFSGRSRGGQLESLDLSPWFAEPHGNRPGLRSAVLTVVYPDGSVEHYHIPLAWYRPGVLAAPLARASGPSGSWDVVEAVDDVGGQALILDCVRREAPGFSCRQFIPDGLGGWRYPGEQSNTSIFYGTPERVHVVAKVFRRLEPGVNPDVELHEALVGSGAVPELYGSWSWGQFSLGIVVAGLPSARDGFLQAREAAAAGRPFTDSAAQLGSQLARVHQVLRDRLGTGQVAASDLAERFRDRFAAAARELPQLFAYREAIDQRYRALGSATVPVQRVHGDCHLGQALATPGGWVYVDFEGEPLKSLQERRSLDSPWRDVAGMLRSFHYALHLANGSPRWASACRAAFLEAYSSTWRDESVVVAAFETDKAVYEAVYESRNRPRLVSVPVDYLSGITNYRS